MIEIEISDGAFKDLDAGFWFYEAQEEGIGAYFGDSLRKDIGKLRISAGIHRIFYKDYHRALSRTFPYAIYYTFADELAMVWAVIDSRRDPEWIRKHLDHD